MKTLIEYIQIHSIRELSKRVTNYFTPGLVSAQITGVQPMTSPTGLIYTIKPRYSDGWTKMVHNANYDRAMKGIT